MISLSCYFSVYEKQSYKVVVSDLRDCFNKLSHEPSKGSCYDELLEDTLFSECFPDEVSEKIVFADFFF